MSQNANFARRPGANWKTRRDVNTRPKSHPRAAFREAPSARQTLSLMGSGRPATLEDASTWYLGNHSSMPPAHKSMLPARERMQKAARSHDRRCRRPTSIAPAPSRTQGRDRARRPNLCSPNPSRQWPKVPGPQKYHFSPSGDLLFEPPPRAARNDTKHNGIHLVAKSIALSQEVLQKTKF